MSVIDLEGNMTHFEIQFPLWFTICLLLVLSAALTFLGLGHRTSSAFRDAAKAQESAVYNNNGNPQPSYNQWQNNADQKYREANRMLQGEW